MVGERVSCTFSSAGRESMQYELDRGSAPAFFRLLDCDGVVVVEGVVQSAKEERDVGTKSDGEETESEEQEETEDSGMGVELRNCGR